MKIPARVKIAAALLAVLFLGALVSYLAVQSRCRSLYEKTERALALLDENASDEAVAEQTAEIAAQWQEMSRFLRMLLPSAICTAIGEPAAKLPALVNDRTSLRSELLVLHEALAGRCLPPLYDLLLTACPRLDNRRIFGYNDIDNTPQSTSDGLAWDLPASFLSPCTKYPR